LRVSAAGSPNRRSSARRDAASIGTSGGRPHTVMKPLLPAAARMAPSVAAHRSGAENSAEMSIRGTTTLSLVVRDWSNAPRRGSNAKSQAPPAEM